MKHAGIATMAGMIVLMSACGRRSESLDGTSDTYDGDGSMDSGLFQINDIHVGSTCAVSRAALFDPLTSARCALRIYKRQGLNAWYGYQYHRSECIRYRLP